MSSTILEELDKEDEQFWKEFQEPTSTGKLAPEKIFGFRLPKTRVYVPELHCPRRPASIYSLLPLYDSVIFPIDPFFVEQEKIKDSEVFRKIHGLLPEEIATLARMGRVFPRFITKFSKYDAKLIKPLLDPGIPRISEAQARLVEFMGFCALVQNDCKQCEKAYEQARKDFPNVPAESSCLHCLRTLYILGYRAKMKVDKIVPDVCMINQTVISRNLDAVFQTSCPSGKKALSTVSSLPDDKAIQNIIYGLRINYVPAIPLEVYADILDTKTTRATRKVVTEMLSDPVARKYEQRLSAKIFEFNQQIQELSESKTAKLYKAVSDIVVYGGSKFVERQSQGYVRVPRENLKRGAGWLASRVLDLHSWITRKDWTIAQLYRTQCKMEKCVQSYE